MEQTKILNVDKKASLGVGVRIYFDNAATTSLNEEVLAAKIGRASCRERVYSSV